MNTLNKNKSIFNYKSGEGGIDSYGVDHSGFTLRDELEYQMARTQREQELLKSYNANGITNNNLINGTSFWGNSADNNYGFGTSNISQNVENVTNQLKNSGEDIIRGSFINKSTSGYASATDSSNTENNSSVWNNMKNTFNNVLPYIPSYPIGYGIGKIHSDLQEPNGYVNSLKNIINLNNQYSPMKMNDKYKHAMINCFMAQNGTKSEKIAQLISGLKENYDIFMNKNTSSASDEDMEANIYGRKIGRKYSNGSCEEFIKKKYKP